MGAEEEQKAMELEEQPPKSGPQTTMTRAEFLAWKQHKDAGASARKAEAERKRAEDVIDGIVLMTGRELFAHEPWVFDNTRF